MRSFGVSLVAVLLVGLMLYPSTGVDGALGTTAVAASSCGLAQPAFCDPLNQPTANGPDVRSGDLDGVVWGVSRGTSSDNPTQGAYQYWQGTTSSVCGQTVTFGSPSDIRICNGALFETVTDGGAATTLGMYPRQPFDIAGRTGAVAFDVSADGLCGHCAWPAFEYTDQPVPAPNNSTSGPRNGFGFTFNSVGTCASASQEGVGNMWVTSNYVSSFVPLDNLGCVNSGVAGGPLNHVEIRMSASHVEVWATDAGASNLHAIGSANLSMPLTRGLVWMEDQHYNANKASTQGTHTFEWANFGFDGPVLPRDLGFDVRDGGTPDSGGGRSLGYLCQPTCRVNIPGVTSAGLSAAQGALLEFTWAPSRPEALNYSFNGHPPHSFPWPYGSTAGLHTIAIPLIVSELQSGSNALTIDASGDLWDLANIDVILLAAGGGGVGGQPTPTNSSTATATGTAASTPRPTNTPTRTPAPTNGRVPAFSSSASASPAQVARGSVETVSAQVTSVSRVANVTIQVRVVGPVGNEVFDVSFTNQSFTAAKPVNVTTSWTPPLTVRPGIYTVQVRVFSSSGRRLSSNSNAATFAVL
jgi:hypothetical protein